MQLPTKTDIARMASSPKAWATECALTMRQTDHGPEQAPFPDYPYLDQLWEAYIAGDDAVVRKTRQMTASWFGAVSRLWRLLWFDGWSSFMLSRKEGYVDDGGSNSTPQSLFGKVRYVYDNLPEWQRLGNKLDFSYLRITNQRNGATLIGASTTARSGAGGYFGDAWIDEAAHMPRSEAVYAALRPACPRGLWLVSTPFGKGNVFARMYLGDSAFRKIDLPWWEHPGRSCACGPVPREQHQPSCWYWRATEGMTPAQIASELDMSFEHSVSGRVWYSWSDDYTGDADRLPGETVYRAWDFGVGDQTAIIYAVVRPLQSISGRLFKQLVIFDAYRNSGMGAVHYRDICQAKATGYPGVIDIGDPHNLSSRDSDLRSWQINLADTRHPYKIHVQPSRCAGQPKERVLDNARKFMQWVDCRDGSRQPRLVVAENLKALIGCFEGWRYPTDDEGRIVGDKPIHDEMSHWMDAYSYLCWHIDPPTGGPLDMDSVYMEPRDSFKEIWV